MSTQFLSIRTSPARKARLKTMAALRGCSLQQAVEQAIDSFLDGGAGFDLLARTISTLRHHRTTLQQAGISGIAVYGSLARGETRDGSDIDLLVEPSEGITVTALRLSGWRVLLSELLGRPADVATRALLRPEVLASAEPDAVEVFRALG